MNTIQTACEKAFASFALQNDAIEGRRCIRALVRAIGPGFHPDSQFTDYVSAVGQALIETDAAVRMDRNFEKVCEVLAASGIDPCEIALPVQRATSQSYWEQT